METIGSYLQQLRRARGWSREEARDKLRDRFGSDDIPSVHTLSMWERGKTTGMSATKLAKVCVLYDADFEEVFRRLTIDQQPAVASRSRRT